MTIFWAPWGALLRYVDGALHIEDLNPEMKRTWVLTRAERLRIGARFIASAILR